MTIFAIYKYFELWRHYVQMAEHLKIERQWEIIVSFVIAIFGFLLTMNVGLYNLIVNHLWNGRTKIDVKYKPCRYKQHIHDPFN